MLIMRNKNTKLVILITLIIAAMITFFNMDFSTGLISDRGTDKITENPTPPEINLMPETYIADLPMSSFCRLDIVGIDNGTNFKDGLDEPRLCKKIHTEYNGNTEISSIYYKGLSGVIIEERISPRLANETLKNYLEENKYLVDIDVYKDRSTNYLKMIFADSGIKGTPQTKLLIAKELNELNTEIYQNQLLNFVLTNIEVSESYRGEIIYFGVLKKAPKPTQSNSSLGGTKNLFKYSAKESYNSFRRSFMKNANTNYMLVDIETYKEDDEWYFAHVWKKTNTESAKNWRFYHNVSADDYLKIKRKMNNWNMRPIDVGHYQFSVYGSNYERFNLIYIQDSEVDQMGVHKKWNHSPHNFNPFMYNDELENSIDKFNTKFVHEKGNIPLLILGPHAGTTGIEGIEKRVLLEWDEPIDRPLHTAEDVATIKSICGTSGYNSHNAVNNDKRTDIIITQLKESFANECNGKTPYIIYTTLYRSIADMNRLLKSFRENPVFDEKLQDADAYTANICAFDSKAAFFPYQAYHDMVEQFVEDIEDSYGVDKAIAIDLHGASVDDEDVDIALGYGGAQKLGEHTMLNELIRSNISILGDRTSSGLIYDRYGRISNTRVRLNFIYGENGLVEQLKDMRLNTYPQAHVGINTGHDYSETDNLNGGFWTRYLSHLQNDSKLAKPNGPRIDTFQIEVMHDGFRDEDSNAEKIGQQLGEALCKTWSRHR